MPMLERIEEPFVMERCKREAWNLFKGLHMHNCYELYYLEEGEIVYFLADDTYVVRAGEFVLVPPGILHKTLPRRNAGHTRSLIYLNPEFLQEVEAFSELLAGEVAMPITMGSRSEAQRLMQGLLAEAEGEANPVMLRAMLTQLLVQLSRWQKQGTVCKQSGVETGVSRKVQEITRYLDTHFAEAITLEALAERFYMNPTYLSRIFRQATGQTFSGYLIRRRLKEAVFLLNTTDKKIMEIAVATGFHSDNHFCKTFRKHLGKSPNSYRK